MIITLVIDQYGEGNNGTTITAMRFTEQLRMHGHTVRIVTASPSQDENIYSTGLRYVPILYEVGKSQGMCFARGNKKVLTEAIKGADLVHFLLPFKVQKLGKKIANQLHVPTTAAFHLQPENITSTIYLNKFNWINHFIYYKFRRFYNQFEHLHCPSKMIANQLKSHGYTSILHVISNGVSPAFIAEKTNKPEELKAKFIILMVGRYSREKRQDLIIKAVKASNYEQDIQIILAGKGPWKKSLVKMARGLTNPVQFGFYSQRELIKVINYADLYVHASDAEIEAISCMEAFTCGLVPIISDSKMSATNQFALTEHNLFKAGNSDNLSEKITYMIEHTSLKKQLSENYIEYAKQYALDACVSELEQVFQQVIEKHKKSKK
jgi:glycosyltransferase involved in cell wall biosynthesis